MKEIIQSIIPVISALLGGGLTFYFQKELINKQFEINKKKIIFEQNRESLAELKSYQSTIIYQLTSLKTETKNFSKNIIDAKTYKHLIEHNIVFLEDIISQAYTLHNKQLDFEVKGLTQLYHDINNFFEDAIQNDKFTDTNMISHIIKTYNSLIKRSKKALKEIIKIASEETL